MVARYYKPTKRCCKGRKAGKINEGLEGKQDLIVKSSLINSEGPNQE